MVKKMWKINAPIVIRDDYRERGLAEGKHIIYDDRRVRLNNFENLKFWQGVFCRRHWLHIRQACCRGLAVQP
jgi:hypothetical protein